MRAGSLSKTAIHRAPCRSEQEWRGAPGVRGMDASGSRRAADATPQRARKPAARGCARRRCTAAGGKPATAADPDHPPHDPADRQTAAASPVGHQAHRCDRRRRDGRLPHRGGRRVRQLGLEDRIAAGQRHLVRGPQLPARGQRQSRWVVRGRPEAVAHRIHRGPAHRHDHDHACAPDRRPDAGVDPAGLLGGDPRLRPRQDQLGVRLRRAGTAGHHRGAGDRTAHRQLRRDRLRRCGQHHRRPRRREVVPRPSVQRREQRPEGQEGLPDDERQAVLGLRADALRRPARRPRPGAAAAGVHLRSREAGHESAHLAAPVARIRRRLRRQATA